MAGVIWTSLVVLLWTSPMLLDCQATELINTFEVNLSQLEARDKSRSARSTEFAPPASSKSTFKWVAGTFGLCYGCGRKSHKAVAQDCVHRLPMQLTIGNYSKPLMGVFKVPDSECDNRRVIAPAPVNVLGCGPPCSELRLLRAQNTGCRCDHSKRLAYDVPKLVCQDNRNRTVSLALCKFFYERNMLEYQATSCAYATVCNQKIGWIVGNWSQCSHESSVHQRRDVVCVVQAQPVYFVMHSSMCSAEERPAKLQACARWTAEKKFLCKCSTGRAERRVLCLRTVRGRKRPVPEADCGGWHLKPETSRVCTEQQLVDCGRSGR